MIIKDKIREADEEIQKFWRNAIIDNISLLKTYYWFAILKDVRPVMKIGEEIVDDGKPKDNISFDDILKVFHSLSVDNIRYKLQIDSFIDWFLVLDEDAYYEETDDDISNFLDFRYMARAWNDFLRCQNE
jgi:hypothetical protein